jgi:uncharacterized protein (DUF302 family)
MTEILTRESPWAVAETITRLLAVIDARGLKLFAVIDHSGEASNVGLDLRDTKLVIFGSPRAGTPVMVTEPLAALDLPLKVLVWADADRTKLSYLAPSALAERYGLNEELTLSLAGIDALVDLLVGTGTAPPAATKPTGHNVFQPEEDLT